MFRLTGLALFIAANLLAVDTSQARREIEAAYARSFSALKNAKTMEDLDLNFKATDTPDSVSIMPGEKPMTWEQMRRYGFETLRGPTDEISFPIETFTMPDAQTAVVQGTMKVAGTISDQYGSFGPKDEKHAVIATAPIRDTWVKTPDGWRRKMHEKLAANKLIVDGKEFTPPARAAAPQK